MQYSPGVIYLPNFNKLVYIRGLYIILVTYPWVVVYFLTKKDVVAC